jgi:hypothetical protein
MKGRETCQGQGRGIEWAENTQPPPPPPAPRPPRERRPPSKSSSMPPVHGVITAPSLADTSPSVDEYECIRQGGL